MSRFKTLIATTVIAPVLLAWITWTAPAFALTGDNLALGKTVTMSSTAPGSPGASCTDGDTTTTICQTGASGAGGVTNQWIDVDLAGEFPVKQIKLFNRLDCCGYREHWMLVVAGDSSLPRPATPAVVYTEPRYYGYVYSNGANGTIGAVTTTQGGDVPAADFTILTIATGPRKVAWVRIFQLDDRPGTGTMGTDGGILNLAEIQVLEGSPFQRTIVNGGFELPTGLPPNTNVDGDASVANGAVSGWSTTDQSNTFEYWMDNFGGFPAFAGTHKVELNAFIAGAISQTICVYPGESFQYTLAHHSRGNPSDVMKLSIDGADIASFSDNSAQNSTAGHFCALLAGAAAASATCARSTATSTSTGWQAYNGNWSNPNASPKAVTFELVAVTSGLGNLSFGNLVDGFSVDGLAATAELSSATASGLETVPTASLPMLLLNGVVSTPQTVQIQITGGTATRGVDYITTPAVGNITVPVPAATYDGTASTAISLAPYIQIQADGSTEGSETILMSVVSPSIGLVLAGASGCQMGTETNTYTILDVAPPLLTLVKSASPSSALVGASVSYTLQVTNTGLTPTIAAATITDTIPIGLTIGALPAGCAAVLQTVTCTIPIGLASGQTVAFVIPVTPQASTNGTTVTNTASVAGGGDQTCPAAAHCISGAAILVTGGETIPTLSESSLAILGLLLAALGVAALRRRQSLHSHEP